VLTEAGLAQLRRYLSEIPAERFGNPMKVADIPRLFTPETFCKLVIHAQREAPAPAPA
jgi:acyl carrier protein